MADRRKWDLNEYVDRNVDVVSDSLSLSGWQQICGASLQEFLDKKNFFHVSLYWNLSELYLLAIL